jgi:predicted nucleic acid-binding protein
MAETKIICDTDVMIDYFDLKSLRHTITKIKLEEEIGLENIMLSAISKLELIAGATTKSDLLTIIKKLKRFSVILFFPTITSLSFELLETYKLSHGLALPDCLIAATVLKTDLEFFTYNTKDFKFIPKLRLHK